MDTFIWNDCFVTGLADVDAQHHGLIDGINRFGTLVVQPHGATREEIDAVIAELAEYARFHFAEEESLMVAAGLDPRHITEHRAAHDAFLSEALKLHRQAANGTSAGLPTEVPAAARALLQFLVHWLAYHILGSDLNMARQMAAIRDGASPAAAYEAGVGVHDAKTEALLNALTTLFQQVTDRNIELVKLNLSLEDRVAERTRELSEANARLEDLANRDVLTGLPNRRHAMRALADAWQAATDDGTPLACMMIDADGFKQINDVHGHAAGDVVLSALATQLRYGVRSDDLVCRLGGDEFLIICTRTPLAGVQKIAEALRQKVAAMRVIAGAGEWAGSVSIGVAVATPEMHSKDELVKAADLGLYAAKRAGRNCVAVASPAG